MAELERAGETLACLCVWCWKPFRRPGTVTPERGAQSCNDPRCVRKQLDYEEALYSTKAPIEVDPDLAP